MSIWSPKFKTKIGQNNPENRRTLSYARGLMDKFATADATAKYFKWVDIHPQKTHLFDGLSVSAIGCGTYLGSEDDPTDRLYEQALVQAGMQGVNFFDTAISYRCMRSEKSLQKVIRELGQHGVGRNQLVIATKGGYLSCEKDFTHFEEYIRTHYLDTGVIEAGEISGGQHCLAPAFLENQIAKSLTNLGIECIDLYLLHNPEVELQELSEDKFYERLTKAFAALEKKVREKKIKRYGLATWNGFRLKSSHKGALQLTRVMASAKEAGGADHHFRAVEMPFNLVMLEAIRDKKSLGQQLADQNLTLLISAPLMQSQAAQLKGNIFEKLPQEETHILQALQFVLSAPNVCTAFVGMKHIEHLEENCKALHLPNWSLSDWASAAQALGIKLS